MSVRVSTSECGVKVLGADADFRHRHLRAQPTSSQWFSVGQRRLEINKSCGHTLDWEQKRYMAVAWP